MNKAYEMGYGPGRGNHTDGPPLPESNNGSFNQMAAVAEVAKLNADHVEALGMDEARTAQFAADHVEALGMDEARTKELIAKRVVSEEMRDLNNAADVAIFGSRGRTEGFVDAAGTPITAPIKGKLDEIRENPRYGTKESDREAAASTYQHEVETLVGEGFELCQAKLIMDVREEREVQHETERRGQNQNYNNMLGKLTNQYMTNGETQATATHMAKERLAKNNITAYKKPTKSETKKADKELKAFVKDNGVFTEEEFVNAYDGTTLYGAQVAPNEVENDPFDDVPTLVMPPLTDPSPRGLRDRVRGLMAAAAVHTQNGIEAIRDYYTSESEGRRRRLTAGTVAAGVLLAGAAYLELKGTSVSHHLADRPKSGTDPTQTGLNPGGPSADGAPALIDHLPDAPTPKYAPGGEGLKLTHQGDTQWHEVSKYLNEHGYDGNNNATVQKVTDASLRDQGATWHMAHNFHVGHEFNIPESALEDLDKVKKK